MTYREAMLYGDEIEDAPEGLKYFVSVCDIGMNVAHDDFIVERFIIYDNYMNESYKYSRILEANFDGGSDEQPEWCK